MTKKGTSKQKTFFLAFIPADDYENWHRRPLLEAIKHRLQTRNIAFVVFKRPQFIKDFIVKKLKGQSIEKKYVKSLFTLLPFSIAIKTPLLFWLCVALPIKIQTKKYLRQSAGIWFCKPNQINYLKVLNARLLFEIFDNYLADTAGLDEQSKLRMEKDYNESISKSNWVFATNSDLLGKINTPRKLYLPNAVGSSLIAKLNSNQTNTIEVPCVGFIGVVSGQIDLQIFEKIAKERPNWRIKIVGVIRKEAQSSIDKLTTMYSNIDVLGAYKYDEMGKYISTFTVGICPYKDNEFNRYRNPMKLYEYAAFGVSTIMIGCTLDKEQKEHCFIATVENVLDIVETAISAAPENSERLISFAMQNTWDSRAIMVDNAMQNMSPPIL
jgi:hypothetical protein